MSLVILKDPPKFTDIYADGHCKPQNDSLSSSVGFARITNENGDDLVKYFSFKIDDDTTFKSMCITTPKGQVDCVQVYSPDVPCQQINYAEITALLMALMVATKYCIGTIYIDSVTSNAWSSDRISKHINDELKLKVCKLATELRKKFESDGGVVKLIKGKDNKADFGYHV